MLRFRAPVLAAALAAALVVPGCSGGGGETDRSRVVFKHGKIEGSPEAFRALLGEFERRNPGLTVVDEALPSSTDEQHQFYIINLEGESRDFDVLAVDVIWVAEFARAGWLREVGRLADDLNDFFPGALEAATWRGRVFALPWYMDAGVLYYRRDLLEAKGFPVPRTWYDLVRTAQAVQREEPGLYGYLWQGKQSESLVCNALELLWSNGGAFAVEGAALLDTAANREALGFLRDLTARYRVSPELVTTADEQVCREIFGRGRALFMRNWPYAYEVYEREGSPLAGRVGLAPLPSFPGHPSASALGGWQLAVSRYARNPEGAERLVAFLASRGAQRELARAVGYKPPRRSLYREGGWAARPETIPLLADVFERVRPRPVSPYYPMITQILQPELSGCASGLKTPAEALGSAERQVRRLVTEGQ